VGSLQLDARGDVLVASGCCGPSGMLAGVAQPLRIEGFWLGELSGGRALPVSLGRDASLADGRIAFVGNSGAGESIELLTLASGARRTVVTFSGTASVSGLALAGDRLAWSQQSSAIVRNASGCGTVFLSAPQLAGVSLRALPRQPFAETGPPAPGPACPIALRPLP
jgi:hypothetical protein